MWPWSELSRLKWRVQWLEQREKDLLWRVQVYENMALKAIREQSAANKGIRRLVEKVKRLQKQEAR